MATTIPCRKVYRFRMEPTGPEALELEHAASVARYVYNWARGESMEYYQQHGKSKPWGELSADLTQLKRVRIADAAIPSFSEFRSRLEQFSLKRDSSTRRSRVGQILWWCVWLLSVTSSS